MGGDIGHQHVRENLTLVQHKRVKQGFQYAAGTSGSSNDIHIASTAFFLCRSVPHIGENLSLGNVDDQDRRIVYFVLLQVLVMPRHQGAHLLLQSRIDGGMHPLPCMPRFLDPVQQMRGQLGQGMRSRGQGL